MHLTRLALTDFRSYTAADLALEPGVSTLLGLNGQGKTNLVEAVAYLATLGSHRVATDAPLIRHGAGRAIVRGLISSTGRDTLVEIEINAGRANRAQVNRAAVPRPRQVLGLLRVVLFAPEDLGLVKGDPEQRRRFLDELLVATAPRYAAVRSDYDRVLRQRTALLKSLRGRPRVSSRGGAGRMAEPGGPDGDDDGTAAGSPGRMLDVWDEQLATLGAELLSGRLGLTRALRPLMATAYTRVAGGTAEGAIGYRSTVELPAPPAPVPADDGAAGAEPGLSTAERGAEPSGADQRPDRPALAAALREALVARRRDEIERGVCLVGPHRDDLEIRIGDLPAKGYASHGESWSAALALRLASYELLRAGGDEPVLLLDDVFAELDAGRRDRLASLVAGAEQVLVTAAVADDVPVALAGARFSVAGGEVTRAG